MFLPTLQWKYRRVLENCIQYPGRKFRFHVVHARHIKAVPAGHKTDIK